MHQISDVLFFCPYNKVGEKMKDLSDYYGKQIPHLFIKNIKINSKEVEKNDLYVCIHGKNVDHHRFAKEAEANKAIAIIASKQIEVNIPVIYVKNTNKELVKLSKWFYGQKENLHLIGVTGTDGKTTVSTIIKQLLGNSCAYLGTNGFYYYNQKKKQENTTPELPEIYRKIAFIQEKKIPYLSMEVSSEALYYNRLKGIVFDGAILTNITSDHMNVHKTITHYVKSKCKLFQKVKKEGTILLNRDDPHYYEVLPHCFGRVFTYGRNESSTFQIKEIQLYQDKTIFSFRYENIDYTIKSPLIGIFNVYNLMVAIAYLMLQNRLLSTIKKRIPNLHIPGRCEVLKTPLKSTIILDYAHTENALRSILSFLNEIKQKRLITVVGSAGGRDKTKRRKMGQVVQQYSDLVIYTMDDPRWENPLDIIFDMLDKTKENYIILTDREKAIFYAINQLLPKDILIICGKGRDNYMAIEDKKLPYSDFEVVEKYFKS